MSKPKKPKSRPGINQRAQLASSQTNSTARRNVPLSLKPAPPWDKDETDTSEAET